LIYQAGVPAGGTCDGKPCWKETSTGFTYNSKTSANGIQSMGLKAGAAGKANLKVKGKGTNLAMPTMPLAQDTTVTVQLLGPTGGICWDANFSAPAERRVVLPRQVQLRSRATR
jgi:hypothetical protein